MCLEPDSDPTIARLVEVWLDWRILAGILRHRSAATIQARLASFVQLLGD